LPKFGVDLLQGWGRMSSDNIIGLPLLEKSSLTLHCNFEHAVMISLIYQQLGTKSLISQSLSLLTTLQSSMHSLQTSVCIHWLSSTSLPDRLVQNNLFLLHTHIHTLVQWTLHSHFVNEQ